MRIAAKNTRRIGVDEGSSRTAVIVVQSFGDKEALRQDFDRFSLCA
jgi:hypothetical protein